MITDFNIIIRVNGTIEPLPAHACADPTAIGEAINAPMTDVINLKDKDKRVMFIDDTGLLSEKPVNLEATKLYHSVCRPGTTHQIHGDVAVVSDNNFSE